jgi:hypothetical protein
MAASANTLSPVSAARFAWQCASTKPSASWYVLSRPAARARRRHLLHPSGQVHGQANIIVGERLGIFSKLELL